MPEQFDFKAFDARLISLGILSAELAEIIGVEVSTVDKWRSGRGKPDAENLIRLRVLDRDNVAALAVQRIRSKHTHSLRGEGAEYAEVEDMPSYGGGYTGGDGGSPQ